MSFFIRWKDFLEHLTRQIEDFITHLGVSQERIVRLMMLTKKALSKLPEQIKRLSIVIGILIGGTLLVRQSMIPASLRETEFHKASTIEREIAKVIRYAGSTSCRECHDEISELKEEGFHRGLSCETCHGPGTKHVEEPSETTLVIPAGRRFCYGCHIYTASRPTGFPQINPFAHNPLKPCLSCHEAHGPEPREATLECSACHGDIARTKSVSHHVNVDCIRCHDTPEEHKSSPRIVRSPQPLSKERCGECHSTNSEAKDVPRVDMSTHGGEYLCWQCHYPHMPETR